MMTYLFYIGKRVRNSGNDDVILENQIVFISCDITVGKTKAPYRVLLDTGSSLLAIPTAGMFQCRSVFKSVYRSVYILD